MFDGPIMQIQYLVYCMLTGMKSGSVKSSFVVLGTLLFAVVWWNREQHKRGKSVTLSLSILMRCM
jgi:hypothetical protein